MQEEKYLMLCENLTYVEEKSYNQLRKIGSAAANRATTISNKKVNIGTALYRNARKSKLAIGRKGFFSRLSKRRTTAKALKGANANNKLQTANKVAIDKGKSSKHVIDPQLRYKTKTHNARKKSLSIWQKLKIKRNIRKSRNNKIRQK